MDDEQLMARFRHLAEYVGLTESDYEFVRQAHRCVSPFFLALVTDFYSEIDRHPETSKIITGGEAQSHRLRGTLMQWLEQLFSGPYDLVYVRRRWQVGRRHVEIGLDQSYTHVAMCRLRVGIIMVIAQDESLSAEQKKMFQQAICRMVDLDLALIQLAYEMELLRKQQQAERLAAIGQMAGGIAHELRNPLNVLQTSLYLLQNSPTIDEKRSRDHLDRMQRQIKLANGTITALSEFTRLGNPRSGPVSIQRLIADLLRDSVSSGNCEIVTRVEPPDLTAEGDVNQISIVLRNLVANAIEAMPNGGKIEINAAMQNDQAERVVIEVRDEGPGVPEEIRQRLTEPLFTTKARGLGLGLALVKAIVEKHRGKLRLESKHGVGATFTIELPRHLPQ